MEKTPRSNHSPYNRPFSLLLDQSVCNQTAYNIIYDLFNTVVSALHLTVSYYRMISTNTLERLQKEAVVSKCEALSWHSVPTFEYRTSRI
jgi:hypothetical protein